jgi:hypothetical protein
MSLLSNRGFSQDGQLLRGFRTIGLAGDNSILYAHWIFFNNSKDFVEFEEKT